MLEVKEEGGERSRPEPVAGPRALGASCLQPQRERQTSAKVLHQCLLLGSAFRVSCILLLKGNKKAQGCRTSSLATVSLSYVLFQRDWQCTRGPRRDVRRARCIGSLPSRVGRACWLVAKVGGWAYATASDLRFGLPSRRSPAFGFSFTACDE